MRKKLVAGNWKMFTRTGSARQLAADIVAGTKDVAGVDVLLCPPFPYLGTVAEVLKGSNVHLGAQDVYADREGAFTGEVSPDMLLDVGCTHVLVGHSERRHVLGEGDALINRKAHIAALAGLQVILCVGETLHERQTGQGLMVFQRQVYAALAGLDDNLIRNVTIAYEPVWAIGTGHNATPEQAQEVHAFIRARFAHLFGAELAASVRILYGGSVKPDNAAALMGQPDVDGVLVGGASLKAEAFLPIIRAGVT